MNQTRITATAPIPGTRGHLARSTVMVSTPKLREASPEAILGLTDLLKAAIRKRGGDPDQITLEAEPIGPQLELVAVDGRRL